MQEEIKEKNNPMTNPSLQEIDEQFDKEFTELDNNKIFKDFCEKYAPAGMFHELHDDNLQSMIAELLAERDEALRKEIHSKSILIRGIKEMDGKLYVRIDREDFNGDSVAFFDSRVLSLLSKE